MHGNVSIYNTCIRKMHPFLIQKQSFLPYLIRLWNSAKKISINSLRKNIIVEIAIPSSYCTIGKRFTNIIHWKLKHNIVYFITIFTNVIFQILNIVYVDITHNISSLHVKIILKLEKIFYKKFLCMAWRKNIYISLQRQDCNSAQYQIYLIFVRDCLIHIWFTSNCSYNPFDLINKIC